jgi:truncated hemoglobin YjbI
MINKPICPHGDATLNGKTADQWMADCKKAESELARKNAAIEELLRAAESVVDDSVFNPPPISKLRDALAKFKE